VSFSLAKHRRAQAVELSCECAAIQAELERLVAADGELIQRECLVHGLIEKRLGVLTVEQRKLSGLLDVEPAP
jgi:hypothetical protein